MLPRFLHECLNQRTITFKLKILATGTIPIDSGEITLTLPFSDIHPWIPDIPSLCQVHFESGNDSVDSYFGMRSFGVGPDSHEIPRLLLNEKPFMQVGMLDQDYWSDGMRIAPSEALSFDIKKAKEMGFNMLRKHVKVEPLRWYCHCDTLGMIVWQDIVSGGHPYFHWIVEILPIHGFNIPDKIVKMDPERIRNANAFVIFPY